jgi:hypothetical protein
VLLTEAGDGRRGDRATRARRMLVGTGVRAAGACGGRVARARRDRPRRGPGGTRAPSSAGVPVPVRVRVTADRLVKGTLEVTVGRAARLPVALPVEVPGGSQKQFLVVAHHTDRHRRRGTARFAAVGEADLDQAPASLAPPSTIGLSADELVRLAPAARQGLLGRTGGADGGMRRPGRRVGSGRMVRWPARWPPKPGCGAGARLARGLPRRLRRARRAGAVPPPAPAGPARAGLGGRRR